MTRKTSLHDENLKAQLKRLMSGDVHVEDIAKLYVGKRSASYGRESFRELADFAAHPDLRNRSPVTDRIRDMRVTFKPLIDRAIREAGVDIADVLARAEANFRMASDEQISGFSGGRKRKEVQPVLRSAVEKMRNGAFGSLTEDEQRIAISFGDRLVWNPALRAQEVFEDFKFVMVKNGLVEKAEGHRLDCVRSLVILHAISVMHGVAFDLGGMTGELQAGYDNQHGCLEVTAVLNLEGYPKAVAMKVGLFWSDLMGRDHVGPALIDHPGPWTFAIEVKDARLEPIGSVASKAERPADVAIINI